MPSTPVSHPEQDIKTVSEKIDIVEDLLELLNNAIEVLEKAEKQGQLDPRIFEEAIRQMAPLKGATPGYLEKGVEGLRAEWREIRGDLEKVEGDADAYEKVIVLRKRANECLAIGRGLTHGAWEGTPSE